MTETTYTALAEHTEKIWKTTFIVTSFFSEEAVKTAEQLILRLLENKIISGDYEMKVSA